MMLVVVALLPSLALGQMVTGGVVDATVSPMDEPVEFAVDKINEHLVATSGGQSQLILLDIVKARTQVSCHFVLLAFYVGVCVAINVKRGGFGGQVGDSVK